MDALCALFPSRGRAVPSVTAVVWQRLLRCKCWKRATVLYDVTARDATRRSLALRFFNSGRMEAIEPPPIAELTNTRWAVKRQTRSDSGCEPRIIKTLEDAPFYSRTLLEASVQGVKATAIHESLDLNRFSSRWVQCLLPFRMPRKAR
jgi:carotenoid 1,2-hydratase